MATSTTSRRSVNPRRRSGLTSTDRSANGRLLLQPAESSRIGIGRRGASPAGPWHFFRHLGEMVLAMMVGMCGLGALDGVILSAAGTSVRDVRNSAPELVALVMAFNMTVGMTVWMRYRRHSWAMCAEMAGAMFLPAVAAIVLFWCGVIHGRSVAAMEMAAMVPAMIAVMLLRRNEYAQPVRSHAREAIRVD